MSIELRVKGIIHEGKRCYIVQKKTTETSGCFIKREIIEWRGLSGNGMISFPRLGYFTHIMETEQEAIEFMNLVKEDYSK